MSHGGKHRKGNCFNWDHAQLFVAFGEFPEDSDALLNYQPGYWDHALFSVNSLVAHFPGDIMDALCLHRVAHFLEDIDY